MDFITVNSLLRWIFILWKPELFVSSILYAILDFLLYFHLSAQTLILVLKPCLTRALIGNSTFDTLIRQALTVLEDRYT